MCDAAQCRAKARGPAAVCEQRRQIAHQTSAFAGYRTEAGQSACRARAPSEGQASMSISDDHDGFGRDGLDGPFLQSSKMLQVDA